MIASAPWAARGKHTSVIDAAGAIYVIGGMSWKAVIVYILGVREGYAYLNDVWASIDQGARACARVCVRAGCCVCVCSCKATRTRAHKFCIRPNDETCTVCAGQSCFRLRPPI